MRYLKLLLQLSFLITVFLLTMRCFIMYVLCTVINWDGLFGTETVPTVDNGGNAAADDDGVSVYKDSADRAFLKTTCTTESPTTVRTAGDNDCSETGVTVSPSSSSDQLVSVIKDTLDECKNGDALDCARKIAAVLVQKRLLASSKTQQPPPLNVQYMVMINNGTIVTNNDSYDTRVSTIVSRVFDMFMEKFNGASLNDSSAHHHRAAWTTAFTTIAAHINSVAANRSKVPLHLSSSTVATTSPTTTSTTNRITKSRSTSTTAVDDRRDDSGQKSSKFAFDDTFDDDIDTFGVQPNLCDLLNSYRLPKTEAETTTFG